MNYFLFLFCFLTSFCFAELDLFQNRKEQKISVQNQILTKVNGNAISVLDVMKKMDLMLHQNYPQYADSPPARFQFYASSWRQVFMELVDTELVLSDAQDKEIKLTEGDVREEMEQRFGPSITQTLEKLHLSYDEAWKMVRKELIMQRMLWFFVHSKAINQVTPEKIRQSYRSYLEKHPAYQDLVYRVITIRGTKEVEEIHQICLEQEAPLLASFLKEWQSSHPDADLQVSNEYSVKTQDLSTAHRDVLTQLDPGTYSPPLETVTREGKKIYRIFHLIEKKDHPAPSFETLASQLKSELLQKAVAKESELYLTKLRKHYGFDAQRLKETISDDLQPFSLQ